MRPGPFAQLAGPSLKRVEACKSTSVFAEIRTEGASIVEVAERETVFFPRLVVDAIGPLGVRLACACVWPLEVVLCNDADSWWEVRLRAYVREDGSTPSYCTICREVAATAQIRVEYSDLPTADLLKQRVAVCIAQ